jgi:hypothetical protein
MQSFAAPTVVYDRLLDVASPHCTGKLLDAHAVLLLLLRLLSVLWRKRLTLLRLLSVLLLLRLLSVLLLLRLLLQQPPSNDCRCTNGWAPCEVMHVTYFTVGIV